MTALDVISLDSAKASLVVDYNDRDVEITRYIETAISLVETYTCYKLYKRNLTYNIPACGNIEVYDYPISLTGVVTKDKAMSVVVYGTPNTTVTASVGYNSVSDIPRPLVDAAYKLITYLFENRDVYSMGLPVDVQLLINQLRRSATF